MAVSDEEKGKVQQFLDQNGYTVRTSAGSTSGGSYGVSGIPASFLIGADGKIVWSGSPFELSEAQIEVALKGVKPGTGLANILSVPATQEYSKRLKPATDLGAAGKPGKALAAVRTIVADEKAEAQDKSDAEHYELELTGHAKELATQIEALIEAKDMVRAVDALEMLAKEFAGLPEAKLYSERLASVKADKALSKELDASKAFDKCKKDAAKLAGSKAKVKYADFAEKWKGTRAGERALALSKKKD